MAALYRRTKEEIKIFLCRGRPPALCFSETLLSVYLEKLIANKKCFVCCLLQEYCICKELVSIRYGLPVKLSSGTFLNDVGCINDATASFSNDKKIGHVLEELHISVFIHVKERFKASNTGKVIKALLTDSSYNSSSLDDQCSTSGTERLWGGDVLRAVTEFVTYDVPSEEGQFLQNLTLEKEDDSCLQVVLFPSSESRTFQQMMDDAKRNLSCKMSPFSKLHIIILDGTWRQARRMNKRLPDWLPRVCLREQRVSDFHIRQQSQQGRISTVESVAYMLEEIFSSGLVASNSSKSFFSVAPRLLLHGLALLVDAFIRQTHREGIRDALFTRNAACKLPPPPPSSISHSAQI